jgi:probable rRNA maturation factor
VTDVISFPLEDLDWPGGQSGGGANSGLNGEIIASAELAVLQAQTTNTDPKAELMLYLVHGLLHLMGYDDRKPEQARQMHAREDALLEEFGFGCVYAGRTVVQ